MKLGSDKNDEAVVYRPGHDRLWLWFGLSYASFLTLPRVLMHEMPDDWQLKMAELLEEYNEAFTYLPDLGSTVRATRNGRIVAMPDVFKDYRHPDYKAIAGFK